MENQFAKAAKRRFPSAISFTVALMCLACGLAGCSNRSSGEWDVMPADRHTIYDTVRVLNDFHDAAAKADGPRYFAHFAPDAVFLGTDATERWTLDEFKKFAEPYFSKGKGWTYTRVPGSFHFQKIGEHAAAFDELLDNDKLGRCRGSGVMISDGKSWKILKYNLTMMVPNEIAEEVAKQSRAVMKK